MAGIPKGSTNGEAREARIDALARALAAAQAEAGRLAAALADARAAQDAAVREVSHRAKNTLHLVGSLLSLQRNRTEDVAAQRILDTAVERIAVLGRIQSQSADLAGPLSSRTFLGELCHDLQSTHARGRPLTIDCRPDDLPVPLDIAVPLGLIVNELLGNSLRHAFPDGRAGSVAVHYGEIAPGHRRLTVADDGTGIPDGRDGVGFGLMLVKVMTAQLKGRLTHLPGPGTAFQIDHEA